MLRYYWLRHAEFVMRQSCVSAFAMQKKRNRMDCLRYAIITVIIAII